MTATHETITMNSQLPLDNKLGGTQYAIYFRLLSQTQTEVLPSIIRAIKDAGAPAGARDAYIAFGNEPEVAVSFSSLVFSRYRMALKTLDKSANLKCGPKIRHPTHVLQLTEIMSPANPQVLVDLASRLRTDFGELCGSDSTCACIDEVTLCMPDGSVIFIDEQVSLLP